MGEAKRRRRAGTHPEQVPAVEDWRVPDGMVAVTLDIEGETPGTLAIQAETFTPLMERMDRIAAALSYAGAVKFAAEEFIKARRENDREGMIGAAYTAFWTALNHPKFGSQMRRGISASLRQDGKAHLTWRFGSKGLAIALGASFTDLAGITITKPTCLATGRVFDDIPQH
jgi:hypothetical protein